MMKRLVSVIAGCLTLLTLTGCFSSPQITLIKDAADPLIESVVEGSGEEKILIIPVFGVISSKSEKGFLGAKASLVQETLAQFKKAASDPAVKAVVLKVDSPGGTVTASDILYHEIKKFREATGKPVVVSFLNIGASGAYYLALPADKIFAHPTSVVGSVGVIFIRPKVYELMGKIGIDVSVSKSGEKKDLGSPFKKTSKEELAFSQNLTDRLAGRFFSLVNQNRQLTPEAFEEIKTAGVYLPEKALELGLIDAIGYMQDAVSAAIELAGVETDVTIITYRRSPYADDTLYNTIGAKSNTGGISAIKTILPAFPPDAGFYYLSPVLAGF